VTIDPPGTSTADVAVVIPVKDRAAYLESALESVGRQTVRPSEVIVVDDASSDGSAEIAEVFGATVVRLPSSVGSGLARNAGIAAATAEWVAFLDSDDTWELDHLARLTARATAPLVLLTTTARVSTGGLMGNTSSAEVPLDSARCFAPTTIVVTSGTMVRRQTLSDAGLFRSLPRVQDLDLWARVLEHGPGLALAAPTVIYRKRGRYTTVDSDRKDKQALMRVLNDLGDRPWMTRSVRICVLARVEWDALRLAQHERRRSDMLRHLSWFAARPDACLQLVRVLRVRREGRARASVVEPLAA